MNRLLRRGRLRLTAAVAVILVLAGGSGATAYWSGQAQLQAQASAASMGLEFQTEPPLATSPLAVTYTAQGRIAAGAVTVRNTGTRDAAGELLISAQSPTAAGLPAAITVAVGSVTNAAECTPQRTLTAPTVKTLSTSSTSFPVAGAIVAGAPSTILCVQTTLQQSAASPSAAQSLQLAMGAKLTYAVADSWSTIESLVPIPQSVAAGSSAPVLHGYARYTIHNGDSCISRANNNPPVVARSATCNAEASQWRMESASNGTFRILAAKNSRSQDQPNQRWTAQPGALALQSGSPSSTAQQWRITATGTSAYRIESVSIPGQCATIGDGLYNKNDVNPRRVVLLPCSPTSAAQVFSFEMVPTPLPADQRLKCVSGWGITLELEEQSVAYEQEIEYRALIARDTTPERRTNLGALGTQGYYTDFQIDPRNDDLATFVGANGSGNATVYVEQRIAKLEWMPIASAQVHTTGSGSNTRILCGWQ